MMHTITFTVPRFRFNSYTGANPPMPSKPVSTLAVLLLPVNSDYSWYDDLDCTPSFYVCNNEFYSSITRRPSYNSRIHMASYSVDVSLPDRIVSPKDTLFPILHSLVVDAGNMPIGGEFSFCDLSTFQGNSIAEFEKHLVHNAVLKAVSATSVCMAIGDDLIVLKLASTVFRPKPTMQLELAKALMAECNIQEDGTFGNSQLRRITRFLHMWGNY